MKNYFFPRQLLLGSSLLGLVSALTLNTGMPVNAQAVIYRETGGRESFRLDSNTLEILESIGLSLSSFNSTVEPAPGYSIGSLLLPPSSDPGVRGTTFLFAYDQAINLYFPVEGSEEFVGDLIFNVDQSQLNLGSQLTIGNFSNRFEFSENDFNFFAVDTANTGLRIFDIESPGIPTTDLNTQTWFLENITLYFSQEFSDYLTAAGSPQSIAGLRFAESRAERSFVPASPGGETPESIPESSNMIALGLIGILGVFVRKVH